MKRHQTLLGVLGATLVLMGILAFCRRDRPPLPDVAVKAETPEGSIWNASSQRHHRSRQKSAPSPFVDLLHERIVLALEAAEREQERKKGDALLRLSFLDIAFADVPRAVALLQKENLTELGAALQFFLLQKWVQNDPIAAEDWVGQMPESEVRQKTLEAVASEWAQRQLRQQSFLRRQMVENDPMAAAEHMRRMPSGERRQEVLDIMALKLSNQSFSKAIAWARELPESDERQNALLIAASSVAETSPMEALRVAAELAANAGRDDLIAHAAKRWAVDAGESAAEWANQIPDAELRERVLASIAVGWCERDPIAATRFALTTLKTGQQQDEAIVGIVQRWVQKEPNAVTEWVSQFPEGQLRERVSAFLPAP